MSLPWNTTVRNAIASWVRLAAGYAVGKVIWEDQDGPRPATPFAALRMTTIRRIGQDWVDVVDAEVPAPGAEIEHRARGVRIARLQIQAFGTDAVGDAHPMAILEEILLKAKLPSFKSALQAASVAVIRHDPVRNVGALLNTADTEPRALVDVELSLVSEISETGTFVEFVELENIDTGNSTYVPEDPSP